MERGFEELVAEFLNGVVCAVGFSYTPQGWHTRMMQRPHRIPPGPGQESVWDYPRPPRCEPTSDHVEIEFAGVTIADSRRTLRVLETSHPPVYYVPIEDLAMEHIRPSGHRPSFCEWKGVASYFSVEVDGNLVRDCAWGYARPTDPYVALRDHLAFYPGLLDACRVNGEPVQSQPGGFYGGWITPKVVGPFKGAPGTMGW